MLAQNLANKEIADRLGLSANTVRFHLSNVYRKTGASTGPSSFTGSPTA